MAARKQTGTDDDAAVSTFISTINKKYGANSIVTFNSATKEDVEVIPTGSIALDVATGIGGYPLGRFVELLGNPSSGKTTLALHAIANAQAMGKRTLYIDAEHSLDISYARALGVDINEMFLVQPDFGEQGLQIAEEAATSGLVSLIVVDSVAALVPKREIDAEIGDATVGLQARMMSQTCRKLAAIIHRHNVLMLFINQYRMNIGMTGYGGPTKTTPGGKALEYYASMRIEVARTKSLGDSDDGPHSNMTQATIKKNKMAPPYRVAEFEIEFGVGISKYAEIVDMAEQLGIVKRTGAWYKTPEGAAIAQGKQNFVLRLKSDSTYTEELYTEIRKRIA